MSTIMKALDRLDKEKAAEESERSLREEVTERHTVPRSSGSSRRPILIGASAGLAVLMVGFALVFSGALTGTPDGAPVASSPASLAAVSAQSERDRPVPLARHPQSGRKGRESRNSASTANVPTAAGERSPALRAPEGAGEESLPAVSVVRDHQAPAPNEVAATPSAAPVVPTVVTRAVPEPRADAPPVSAPRADAPPVPTPVFTTSIAENERIDPAPRATASEPDAFEPEIEAFALAPPPSVPSERVIETSRSLPGIESGREPRLGRVEPMSNPPPVSAAPGDALRDVRVARTIWHPTPDRRYAFLEVSGQAGSLRVREGDQIGRLGVKKIEPWGVVFLDDGVEIQHRVGERN